MKAGNRRLMNLLVQCLTLVFLMGSCMGGKRSPRLKGLLAKPGPGNDIGTNQQCCDSYCCSYCELTTTDNYWTTTRPPTTWTPPVTWQPTTWTPPVTWQPTTWTPPVTCPPCETYQTPGPPTCPPQITCPTTPGPYTTTPCPPASASDPKFTKATYKSSLPSWPAAGTTIHLGIHANTTDGAPIRYELISEFEFIILSAAQDIMFTLAVGDGAYVGPNNVMVIEIRALVIGDETRRSEATVVIVFPRSVATEDEELGVLDVESQLIS